MHRLPSRCSISANIVQEVAAKEQAEADLAKLIRGKKSRGIVVCCASFTAFEMELTCHVGGSEGGEGEGGGGGGGGGGRGGGGDSLQVRE